MRPVEISDELVGEIRRHAREAYPDECCGFLFARATPGSPDAPRTVVGVQRAPNQFEGERRRRFVIRPEELRAAERATEGTEREVAGFYHSHPDHPARPSTFDEEHAWPWYSYLVVSVSGRDALEVAAFELEDDTGRFQRVPLRIASPAVAGVTENLRTSGAR